MTVSCNEGELHAITPGNKVARHEVMVIAIICFVNEKKVGDSPIPMRIMSWNCRGLGNSRESKDK